ncbi:MAG TPA: Mu-like prophage major head subunit gpT family protein [Planctomycetota bacterium]|nr:Mu-like prophage major head subunit gpT family protein [Planctomycetota bacterium]HRT95528.1 Mu-like prophage major head subunit gpT family protein [Planctomycetota bacterium]
MGLERLGVRGIIGRYYRTLQERTVAAWATLISVLQPSDQELETYEATGMVPPLSERQGGLKLGGVREFTWTIHNRKFQTGVTIPRDWLRRDKTGQIMRRIDELAIRGIQHWTKLISDLIAAGGATTIYDGAYFFAASGAPHSAGSSGSQINDLTANEVAALNVGTAAAPTAGEMASAILNTISYMMGYKDDQGEPVNADATNWLVLCPKGAIYASALEAMQPLLLNQAGEVLRNQFRVQVAVDPRSAETVKFYLFRTGDEVAPVIRQEETAAELEVLAEGSDRWVEDDEALFKLQASRNVGFGQWESAARCTLS